MTQARPVPPKQPPALRLIRRFFSVLSLLSPTLAARFALRFFFTPGKHPRPAREQPWLDRAQRFRLHLHGREVETFSWGTGPTVLLVHGWAGRATQLSSFAASLIERGYRVCSFDAPAHGASPGRRTNLPEIAGIIGALDTHWGPFEGVVAHSMGVAATALALKNGLRARRVVLIAGPFNMQAVLAGFGRFIALGKRVLPHFTRLLTQRVGLTPDRIMGPQVVRHLDTPAVIIHDEEDRQISSRQARDMADHWAGSRLEITRGLGHHRILADPRIVSMAVDFITDADSRHPSEGSRTAPPQEALLPA